MVISSSPSISVGSTLQLAHRPSTAYLASAAAFCLRHQVSCLAVPVDGRRQPGREVAVARLPAELGAQLGRVDRVATVMAGPVGDQVVVVRLASHRHQQRLDDLPVRRFPVGADEIRLADPAALEHRRTAEQWSSTCSQSRTFSPSPYSFGRTPSRMFVI